MSSFTLSVVVFGYLCSLGVVYSFGVFTERRAWNRLIKCGVIPAPGKH